MGTDDYSEQTAPAPGKTPNTDQPVRIFLSIKLHRLHDGSQYPFHIPVITDRTAIINPIFIDVPQFQCIPILRKLDKTDLFGYPTPRPFTKELKDAEIAQGHEVPIRRIIHKKN